MHKLVSCVCGSLCGSSVSRRFIVLARVMRPRGVSELRSKWAFSIMEVVRMSLIEGKDRPVDVDASM